MTKKTRKKNGMTICLGLLALFGICCLFNACDAGRDELSTQEAVETEETGEVSSEAQVAPKEKEIIISDLLYVPADIQYKYDLSKPEELALAVYDGEAIFKDKCWPCHGDGSHQPGTTTLKIKYGENKTEYLEERTDLIPKHITFMVRQGRAVMVPFRLTAISHNDLRAVIAYLTRNNPTQLEIGQDRY